MNLVFMNSLEKETAPGRFRTAAVSIVEEKGKHQIHWREPDEQGNSQQDMWYEGDNWEEMLSTFQLRLTEKMADGFIPVIDRLPLRPDQLSPAARFVQTMYFYSERNNNEALYQSLRIWRKDRAAKDGRAPFIVASNRLLRMISTFVPHNTEELLQLPGFGQNKLAAYGQEIVQITQKVKQDKPFPLQWVSEHINQEEFLAWLYAQKELKFKAEAEQLARKKQLLQSVYDGERLKQLEDKLGLPMRDIVIHIERLEDEGYDLYAWIEQELESIDASEKAQVMQAFEKHGHKYLKPALEAVYTTAKQQEDSDALYIKLRLLRLQYRKQIVQQEGQAG